MAEKKNSRTVRSCASPDASRVASPGASRAKSSASRAAPAKRGKPSSASAAPPSVCSKCGKPAAITLRYANIDLCQSHFTKMFEARVLRTVREHRMLRRGDFIAIGLSGGKDSSVMLHLLHKIRQSLPIKLHAITIDEGISGYRAETLAVAKEECKKLGIPLTVVSFRKEFGKTLDSLLKVKGEGRSCSFCGVMRKNALNLQARKLGASKLAIGHNSDDVAQTVIMNFMRNEPERLARFSPISNVASDETFIPRIKPLFTTPERDIAAYAMMKGIGIRFRECPYAKFAFRQHVRKMLNEAEEKYPGTKLRIVRAHLGHSSLLSDGLRFRLKKDKEGRIGKCNRCGEPSSQEFCNLCKLMGE